MHFHELLLGDFLVELVGNRDCQEQSRPGDAANGAQHVGHHGQQADERATQHSYLWDILF